MFIINNLMVSSSSNFLYYLGAIIISGIDSGYFFVLGGCVLLLNFLAMVLYLQAEREMSSINDAMMRVYDERLEDFIFGVDSIRALERVDEHRILFMDALYTYNAVMKANMRWLT